MGNRLIWIPDAAVVVSSFRQVEAMAHGGQWPGWRKWCAGTGSARITCGQVADPQGTIIRGVPTPVGALPLATRHPFRSYLNRKIKSSDVYEIRLHDCVIAALELI